MPAYVDGFVLPVPAKNLAAYRRMALRAEKVWLAHGALDYRECALEDPKAAFGLPFSQLVKPKRSETIVFAWITFKSRAHRDRVNAAVMKDPRLKCDPDAMPFDCTRMAYGGFKTLVGK